MGNYSSNVWSTTDAIHHTDPVGSLGLNPSITQSSHDHIPNATENNMSTGSCKNENDFKTEPVAWETTERVQEPNSTMLNESRGGLMQTTYVRQSRGDAERSSTTSVLYGMIDQSEEKTRGLFSRSIFEQGKSSLVDQHAVDHVSSSTEHHARQITDLHGETSRRICIVKLQKISQQLDTPKRREYQPQLNRASKRLEYCDEEHETVSYNGRHGMALRRSSMSIFYGRPKDVGLCMSNRLPSKHARQSAQKRKSSECSAAFDSEEPDTQIIPAEKHLPKFPYKCNQCPAHFRSSFFWQKHLRFHTVDDKQRREVNSSTDRCKKKLSTKDVHEPIVCIYCNRSFESVSKLDQHLLVHVNDNVRADSVNDCDLCGMTFPSSNALVSHTVSHSPGWLESARIVGKRSISVSTLRNSKTNEEHICNFCKKSFPRSSNLKSLTGEKPYACGSCRIKFGSLKSTELHKRDLHAGEKPYACHLCSECFDSTSSRLKHVRSHTDKTGEKRKSCVNASSGQTHKRKL